jgi:hypothetical protein
MAKFPENLKGGSWLADPSNSQKSPKAPRAESAEQ